MTRDTHPHVDRQIPVKTLPFRNFVGGQQKYPHELHVFQIQDSSSEDENPSHIDKPSSSELSTAVITFKKGKKLKLKSYKNWNENSVLSLITTLGPTYNEQFDA